MSTPNLQLPTAKAKDRTIWVKAGRFGDVGTIFTEQSRMSDWELGIARWELWFVRPGGLIEGAGAGELAARVAGGWQPGAGGCNETQI
jgi:hypothetical protein